MGGFKQTIRNLPIFELASTNCRRSQGRFAPAPKLRRALNAQEGIGEQVVEDPVQDEMELVFRDS